MKTGNLMPSKYLKAADLEDDDVTLTIASVEMEDIGQGNNKERRPVIYFRKEKKGLVLNKTNLNVIENLYGDETDDWIGEEITLFATEVEYQGKMVDAIRVKTGKKQARSSSRKSVPKRDEEEDEERPRKKARARDEEEEEPEEEEDRPRPSSGKNKLTGGKGRNKDPDDDDEIPF
jgi:hypothetical protein